MDAGSSQTQVHVVLNRFGAPEVLEVARGPVPRPGPGQVRGRVEASSVQYTDTLIRKGVHPDLKQNPPVVPGYDFVGPRGVKLSGQP